MGRPARLGKNDISSDDSRIKQRIAEAGQWFGETLLRDDALRESLNEHLGAGGAPGGAGVRRLPHPPYQRHSEELGRPRYVAADRAQYR